LAREAGPLTAAGYPQFPILKGLAQLVEYGAAKFPQLIKKQHAQMGQTQLARPW
jgi:hypothetical protein